MSTFPMRAQSRQGWPLAPSQLAFTWRREINDLVSGRDPLLAIDTLEVTAEHGTHFALLGFANGANSTTA